MCADACDVCWLFAACAFEDGIYFEFLDHGIGVAYRDGADSEGDVLEDLCVDAAAADEHGMAEGGVFFEAKDEEVPGGVFLGEDAFESFDACDCVKGAENVVGGAQVCFDASNVAFVENIVGVNFEGDR